VKLRLETERLILRPWKADDRAPFAALNMDPAVMPPEARLTALESDELVDHFEALWRRDGFAFAVAERRAGGGFVGMVGLQRFPGAEPLGPCVEIGWRLAREHWGRGYATEAARAWLAHGFEALGVAEVVAFTDAGNARSLAVMARLGMVRDPARDFVHPEFPKDPPMLVHAIARERWAAA
jgi:RimJ/RimL family protein N-acetyltransferase